MLPGRDEVDHRSIFGHARHGPGATPFFLCPLTTISVCGCATLHNWKDNGFKVGPKYSKPAASVSNDWIDLYDERISTYLLNDASWWDTFGDPIFPGLVPDAFSQNRTLRAAGIRVQQARTIRAIAAGNLLPQQQQAFGNYTKVCSAEIHSPATFPVMSLVRLDSGRAVLTRSEGVFSSFRISKS
jgi:hypothetical protein